MSNQPRLFADYAANPSRRERSELRAYHDAHRLTIFDTEPTTEETCPVCAGAHNADACPHGTAPTLPERNA